MSRQAKPTAACPASPAALLLAALLLAVSGGCEVPAGRPRSAPAQKGFTMAKKQQDNNERFEKIPIGELGPNACSPMPPGAAFKGILIDAPTEVAFKKGQRFGRSGAFARVPICGFYRLSPASPPKPGTILEAMKLVAVDLETGQRYVGAMIDPDPAEPPPPRPAPSRAALANVTVSGYFNPNLVEYVPLPARPAAYQVHVELDDMKSNTVKIRLVESGG